MGRCRGLGGDRLERGGSAIEGGVEIESIGVKGHPLGTDGCRAGGERIGGSAERGYRSRRFGERIFFGGHGSGPRSGGLRGKGEKKDAIGGPGDRAVQGGLDGIVCRFCAAEVTCSSGNGKACDIAGGCASVHGQNVVVVGGDRHPCRIEGAAACTEGKGGSGSEGASTDKPGGQAVAPLGADQRGGAPGGGGDLGIGDGDKRRRGNRGEGAVAHDIKAVDAACGGEVECATGRGGDGGASAAGGEKRGGREKEEKAQKKKNRPCLPAFLLWRLRVERPVPVVLRDQRKGSPFREGECRERREDLPRHSIENRTGDQISVSGQEGLSVDFLRNKMWGDEKKEVRVAAGLLRGRGGDFVRELQEMLLRTFFSGESAEKIR